MLVHEGQVTDLRGNPATLRSENYLACNPTLAPAMLNGLKTPRPRPTTTGIRVTGCASLDLACGRTDAFWEIDLKPWDIAAGQVTGLDGNQATEETTWPEAQL